MFIQILEVQSLSLAMGLSSLFIANNVRLTECYYHSFSHYPEPRIMKRKRQAWVIPRCLILYTWHHGQHKLLKTLAHAELFRSNSLKLRPPYVIAWEWINSLMQRRAHEWLSNEMNKTIKLYMNFLYAWSKYSEFFWYNFGGVLHIGVNPHWECTTVAQRIVPPFSKDSNRGRGDLTLARQAR